MKLSEYSKYRTNRERAEAILHILEGMPGKTLHDDKGLLSSKLVKMLPKHLAVGRSNKPLTTGGMLIALHQMEEAGWIMTEVNGRRTYNIFLISLPEDWDQYNVPSPVQHVPEPMVMPSLPKEVEAKLHPEVPITVAKLREVLREELSVALSEWWAGLK